MQKAPTTWRWQTGPWMHQWSTDTVSMLPKMGNAQYTSQMYLSTIKFVLPKDWSLVASVKVVAAQQNNFVGVCIKTKKTVYYFPATQLQQPSIVLDLKVKFDSLCSTCYVNDTLCPIGNLSQLGIYTYAPANPLPTLDPAGVTVMASWNLYAIDSEVPFELLTHRFVPGGIFQPTLPNGVPHKFIGCTLEGLYMMEKMNQGIVYLKPEDLLPEYTYTPPPAEVIVTNVASAVLKDTNTPSLVEFMIKKLWLQTVQGVPIMEILLALTDRDGLWFPVYITGGSVRDYLLGKEPNDIDLVVGGSYTDVRNRLQAFFASLGKPLTEETLRTDTLTKSFGQMKIMNLNGEPEPLDIALFKCAKIPKPSTISSESEYVFGFSCGADTKFRDYSFNAMYLDIFSNQLYYKGNALDDAKKFCARVVDKDEYVKNDLGGQLRLWKMLRGDPRLFTYDGDFNVKNHVSELLYGRIGSFYNQNNANGITEGVAFFVRLRKKLFKDLQSVTKTSMEWHEYFGKITPQGSMQVDNAITGWWWQMMDFLDDKMPFHADKGLRRKNIMARLPQDVAIVLAMLKKTRPAHRGLDAPAETRGVVAVEGDVKEADLAAASAELQRVVNVNSQIAANHDLQALRTQDKGLFDAFIPHAVPFALQAAVLAGNAIKAAQRSKRSIGVDVAIEQHLPTAINFAQQVTALPEVIENRGFFGKIFSIGMPLVLNTAQTLLETKRSLGEGTDRGFFDSILSNLPSTVFTALSNGIIKKRALGDDKDLTEEGRDLGEDRGFFDLLKKVAPIVLNVASTAASSFGGQRSLSSVPTDRGFFSTLKSVVSKVLSNSTLQNIGATALEVGKQAVTSSSFKALFNANGFLPTPQEGQRAIDDKIPPTSDQLESNARGFFATMLQHLTPIALEAVQGAVGGAASAIAKRDVSVPDERGLFDFVSKYLPAAIQVSHEAFYQKRDISTKSEDQAKYLQKVLISLTPSIIQAATNKNTETDLTKLVAEVAL